MNDPHPLPLSRFTRRVEAHVDDCETLLCRYDEPQSFAVKSYRKDSFFDLPPDEELFDLRGIE